MTASRADHGLSAAIISSIKEGGFPDSEDVLTAELPATALPSILDEVSEARQQLEDEVCRISREAAPDVDEWIAQAKRLHEDIAKSRAIARDVVREHEASKAIAAATQDAKAKLDLLNDEIKYNTQILKALDDLRLFNHGLQALHASLSKPDALGAAAQWKIVRTQLDALQDHNGKRIVLGQVREANRACLTQAEGLLDRIANLGKDSHASWFHIKHEIDGKCSNTHEPSNATIDEVLKAFEHLGALEVATQAICKNVDRVILQPIASHGHNKQPAISIKVDNGRIEISHSPEEKNAQNVLDCLLKAFDYLQSNLPKMVEALIANAVIPDLVSTLVAEWLTPSVPLELSDIPELEVLQTKASALAKKLSASNWPKAQDLLDWVELAPQMWLTRRRMASLDRVRATLALERGPPRQVERIERQVVSKQDMVFAADGEGDDWNTGWNHEDESSGQPVEDQPEEDDVSAWDFDADEEPTADRPLGHTEPRGDAKGDAKDDDSAEAWGWDEDSPSKQPDTTSAASNASQKEVSSHRANGELPQEREVTLKESYTITDIPDYILDIISKDVQEATDVQDPKYSALASASPSSGLRALPTFALAMFRAIAPSYYTSSLPNGNMHLYNDSRYIAEKLRDASWAPELSKLRSDCDSIEKFAKTAYGREMDVQRTILADLLDGAQGFASCTQFPYSKQCEDAVSSVVDRIRQVHQEWSPILSHSALLQSVGSLLSKVIDKMIRDVEDMDDITEPESQRLASFCTQISDLGDLFVPAERPPSGTEVVPVTAVYVSNWLRFQYMANILESSLVDIKYLWTEGELSLEFSAEEVIEMIKALFAESPNRRNAIADIRRSKNRQSR